MSKVNVKLYQCSYIDIALEIISKFKKKNDIDFRLNLLIDHDDKKNAGYYYTGSDLYINPRNCDDRSTGHPEGKDITNVIIHEFGHYLDSRYKILDKYLKYCEEHGNLYITEYAKTDLGEEIAEILMVYLTCPIIFKNLDSKRYRWFEKFFKSPVPCSDTQVLKYWKTWSKQYKESLWKKYGMKVVKDQVVYRKRFDVERFKVK